MTTQPEQHQEINDVLTGPLTKQTTTSTAIDPEAGIKPPPWWRGDEDAARSGLAVTSR